MSLEFTEREIATDITVVELIGTLALGRESQRIETLVDDLAKRGSTRVIFDMSAVDYMDSTGLGILALANGKLSLTGDIAKKPFELWADLKASGVLPTNIAEIVTDRMRQNYQAGNLITTMNWGYVWNRVENDADSVVKGKTGVIPMPGFEAGKSATCIGGWQLAVTAFSKNKAEAVKLIRFLSSPEVSKMQAIMASHMPVFPAVYKDPEVLKANPWFADALPVVESAKSRPVSAQYPQVSDVIRSNMNAYLAGTKTTEVALGDMKSRLTPLFR